jgi:hypothetical protein
MSINRSRWFTAAAITLTRSVNEASGAIPSLTLRVGIDGRRCQPVCQILFIQLSVHLALVFSEFLLRGQTMAVHLIYGETSFDPSAPHCKRTETNTTPKLISSPSTLTAVAWLNSDSLGEAHFGSSVKSGLKMTASAWLTLVPSLGKTAVNAMNLIGRHHAGLRVAETYCVGSFNDNRLEFETIRMIDRREPTLKIVGAIPGRING